jgi:hypothetical protein
MLFLPPDVAELASGIAPERDVVIAEIRAHIR